MLAREAQQGAFTVANVYRVDVLEGFRTEIVKALKKGVPQRTVIKKFESILEGAAHEALGNHHLETVVRTNMASAYGTGRQREMEATTELLPYLAILGRDG